MALANYSDLNTAVANWLGRTDLTSRIPEGITLAEAKINRKLRTKDMETRNGSFPIPSATEYVAVPSAFGGVRQFYLNTTPKQILEFMPGDMLTQTYSDNRTGQPVNYSIEGANFRFGPQADASYTATLSYFMQVPALTSSNTTNWLMTAYPDIYLYGVNAEMSALTKDWETAKIYEDLMYTALAEAVGISNRDKWSGGSLVQRPG